MKQGTWDARIRLALARGTFTDDDYTAALFYSTCAVGEWRGDYREREVPDGSKLHAGTPVDQRLLDLGAEFLMAVSQGRRSLVETFIAARVNDGVSMTVLEAVHDIRHRIAERVGEGV